MHEKGIGKANKHTRKRPQGKGSPAVSYFCGPQRFPLNAGESEGGRGSSPGDAVCLGMEKSAAARGGGGVFPWRAKARHGKTKAGAFGPGFVGAVRPRRPPGPLGVPPTPKGQKARPHALWGRAAQPMGGRGAAGFRSPRAD